MKNYARPPYPISFMTAAVVASNRTCIIIPLDRKGLVTAFLVINTTVAMYQTGELDTEFEGCEMAIIAVDGVQMDRPIKRATQRGLKPH